MIINQNLLIAGIRVRSRTLWSFVNGLTITTITSVVVTSVWMYLIVGGVVLSKHSSNKCFVFVNETIDLFSKYRK